MSVPLENNGRSADDTKQMPPVRVRTRPAQQSENFAKPKPAKKDQRPATADYEVGYGKPPKHTRFKPGQSGNPKGRPKRAKGLNTLVRETLSQKVAVRTAAGHRKISQIEAALLKTGELAMKGNLRALVELVKLYRNAVPDEPHGAGENEREEDLTSADLAILEELRRQLSSEKEK